MQFTTTCFDEGSLIMTIIDHHNHQQEFDGNDCDGNDIFMHIVPLLPTFCIAISRILSLVQTHPTLRVYNNGIGIYRIPETVSTNAQVITVINRHYHHVGP